MRFVSLGTRRQGEIWDGLNGERGEDADSAVNNHLISNKLLSSIKQVLAGADEDEEQGRLRETEALNKLEAAVGTSLQDRKHEDHQVNFIIIIKLKNIQLINFMKPKTHNLFLKVLFFFRLKVFIKFNILKL